MSHEQLTCDPARIERFLEQRLSDDEQAAFESHLDHCHDCRRQLEAAAAGDDVWSGVRESLESGSLGLDPREGDSTDPPTAEDAPFNHDTVLNLLAPTDDDRMIGRVGTYEVLGVVGSGGMGVVLKAFEAPLNRYVAIKVLAPHLGSSGAARKRFSREAQAAAAVVHDNVIEIHGVDDLEGLPYLVMPYVRGPSLQRRLDDDGPLALVEILRIGMQAATGLAAAHAQGLVHRDVKPANILLADGVERVKLTDFGLARAADDASLTKTGIIAGTPQYMSPEQARGESVDQRSDLFSLGSVLYAMCTGRAPFRAETSYGVLRRITDEEPQPIQELNPDIPQWLCQIVSNLMSKEPDDRFESSREVADLLEECLAHVQQPTVVPLPKSRLSLGESNATAGRKAANFGRRPPFTFLVAAGFAFAFLFAGVLIFLELNKGTLQIECDTENVPVRITQGDTVVQKLTVTRKGASVRVAAGKYLVEIADDTNGIAVKNGTVVLQRGGRVAVKIMRKEKTPGFKYFGNRRVEFHPVPDGQQGRSSTDAPARPIYGGRNPKTSEMELNPSWANPVRRMLGKATAIEVKGSGRNYVSRQIPPNVQGEDSERLIGVVVALVADGSVSWKSGLQRVFVISTDRKSAQFAATMLPAALDRLARPDGAAPPEHQVDNDMKQDDPRMLKFRADNLGETALDYLLSGESHDYQSARWFWELSRSFHQEADLRANMKEFDELAKKLRAAGRFAEAEASKFDSEQVAAQAEAIAAQRQADQVRRDQAERVRDEAKRLASQIEILREDGKEQEIPHLEKQLDTLLRQQDPDSFRVRDLRERIIDARTRGRHEVADLLDTERQNLIKTLDRRYPKTSSLAEDSESPEQATALGHFKNDLTDSRGLEGNWKVLRFGPLLPDPIEGAKVVIDKQSIRFYLSSGKEPSPHYLYTCKPGGGIDIRLGGASGADVTFMGRKYRLDKTYLGKYLLKEKWLFIAFHNSYDISSRPLHVTGEIPQRGVMYIVLEKEQAAETADLSKLQGRWRLEKLIVRGRQAGATPGYELGNEVVVSGKWWSDPHDRSSPSDLSLDPSKNPKQFTLNHPRHGVTNGLYRLNGDTLEILMSARGTQQFPSSFEDKATYGQVFKRATQTDPASESNANPTLDGHQRLQGVWQVVSGQDGGRPLDGDDLQFVFMVSGGAARLQVFDDGEAEDSGTYTIDASRNPKAIDVAGIREFSHSPDDPRLLGIYEFAGKDRLRLCFSEQPKDGRPTKFASERQGVNDLLLELRLVNKNVSALSALTFNPSAGRREPVKPPLWNEFGVTSGPVSPLTAKVLEWVGLHLHPIQKHGFRDKNVLAKFKGGLDVTFVRTGGPAEKAGVHDVDIVVGIQQQSVAALEELDAAIKAAIEQIAQGRAESIQLDVLRSGKTIRVNVPFPVNELDLETPPSNSDPKSPKQEDEPESKPTETKP